MKRLLNSNGEKGVWRQSAVALATAGYLLLALVPAAQASDTEVYAGSKGLTSSEMAPTLMMQLDSARTVSDAARFAALKGAMFKVLKGDEASGVQAIPGFVRMGYSRYQPDGNNGGWVRYPARPLDALADINPDGTVESVPTAGSDDVEFKAGVITMNGTRLNTNPSVIAVRFPALNVPRNATIINAYIEFTPANTSNQVPDVWRVAAQKVANAPTFAATENISSRTYDTVAEVNNGTTPWTLDTKYRVAVTTPLSTVVSGTGTQWCGGNAVVFALQNKTSSLDAYSFEGDSAKAPRLVVEWILDESMKATSCITASFTEVLDVVSGNDDIELAASTVAAANTNLSTVKNKVALRFVDEDGRLYRNATVSAATLYLTGDVPGTPKGKNEPSVSGVPAMTVSAFDTDNLAAFCSGTPATCTYPSTSTITGASVSWNPGTVVNGTTYSMSVLTAVQNILNKSTWAPGNALGFNIQVSSGTSTNTAAIRSKDSTKGGAAQLVISGTQQFTDLSKLKTVRDEIYEEITKMTATSGGTPLADAYQETMRYLMGLNVSHGQAGADTRVLTDATKDKTGTDRQFQSPLTERDQCAANYIFMLASGEWGNSSNTTSGTENLTGRISTACSKSYYKKHIATGTPTNDEAGWACMFTTAEWGANATNQQRSIVRTNTVVFNDPTATVVQKNLAKVAELSGGDAFLAGDEAELVNAIMETVDDLLKESGTITAPGVAVNQLNRLNNLDQLYYAVFQPTNGRNWPGNVKRYQLDIVNEQVLDNGDPQKSAIDEATSFFDPEAESWWLPEGDEPDGNVVQNGGVARILPDPATRKMFAYIGAIPSDSADLVAVGSDLDANKEFVEYVKTENVLSSDAEAQNLINWYKGYAFTSNELPADYVDPATLEHRQQVGAVLHSRPILVNYGFSGSAEEAATDPDLQKNYIFFSTLEGTLHAVEAKTGVEKFAFIPGEKLAKLALLFKDENRSALNDLNPEFGMDLTWSVYRKSNPTATDGSPAKVYIYGGMRMGGNNYYALDVTDLDNPKLLFTIKGGEGDFINLGQTWSQPIVATVRVSGTITPVLIFAGGYKPDEPYEVGGPTYPETALGNQLFIVHAETGELIWSSDEAEMDDPIPSQPKTADVNGDGLVDHIYVGDLGGKVFRVDLDNRSSASSLVKRVKVFADVSGDNRRFYEPPTVALFKDSSNQLFAVVGMGSGNRSHPLLESTNDRFYAFYDTDITRADILTATDDALQDKITESTLAGIDLATFNADTFSSSGKQGWYLEMDGAGEKVITSAVIFRNKLVFSSYLPTQENTNDCSPVIGSSNLYNITLDGGAPTVITVKERVVYGLGADPQIIILPNKDDPTKSDAGIVTGTDVELEGEGISAGLQRTRWFEKTKH